MNAITNTIRQSAVLMAAATMALSSQAAITSNALSNNALSNNAITSNALNANGLGNGAQAVSAPQTVPVAAPIGSYTPGMSWGISTIRLQAPAVAAH